MNELDQLAIFYGTDKSSKFHNYTEIYDRYFSPLRDKVCKLLEIGVWHGESMLMWREYFHRALIYGIDIDRQCKKYESERIKIIIADATKPMNLYSTGFDIIIDDGCHGSQQTIKTFELFFDHVIKGGWYVIEDTMCSYLSSHGGGLRKPGTTIEYFKLLIDHVNFMGYCGETYASDRNYLLSHGDRMGIKFSYWTKNIRSIHFYNGLILIERT
jgi:hypothetical protein